MSVDLTNAAKQTFSAVLKTSKYDGLHVDERYNVVIWGNNTGFKQRRIDIMKETPHQYYYDLDGTQFNEDFAEIQNVVIDENKGGGAKKRVQKKSRRTNKKSKKSRKTKSKRT